MLLLKLIPIFSWILIYLFFLFFCSLLLQRKKIDVIRNDEIQVYLLVLFCIRKLYSFLGDRRARVYVRVLRTIKRGLQRVLGMCES